MKKLLPSIFLLPVFLVSSCSTTFTEYRGPDVAKGTGGTVRVVKGVDFWENGTPDRSYRILGVIDHRTRERSISHVLGDNSIAAEAKKHGGDAVIFMESNRFPSRVNKSGNIDYEVSRKLMVVKYLD